MAKKLMILLLNIILVAMVICNLGIMDKRMSGTEVNVAIDANEKTSENAIAQSKRAILLLPSFITEYVSNEGWTFSLKNYIEPATQEFENYGVANVVGQTNTATKTIEVLDTNTSYDFVFFNTLHEYCHVIEVYYDNVSVSDEFMALYEKYADTYIPREFQMNPEIYEPEIAYATSDCHEFFATACADFLYDPDYLKTYMNDLYGYFDNLLVEKK